MGEEVEALKARIRELEEHIEKLNRRVTTESRGRTSAEIQLRKRFLAETSNVGSSIKIIGYVRTVFPQKFGTPRQGLLANCTRGSLELDATIINGSHAFRGLEGFSHAWLVTIFHENTNMHKIAKDPTRPQYKTVFPALVRPPQAGGTKVGLFATRTPHRPNPIALSLVSIDRVDFESGVLHMRGLDLVDGTPVLDIKPYLAHIDNPQESDPETPVRKPDWVLNPKFSLVPVKFSPQARKSLKRIVENGQLDWYAREELHIVEEALVQVLRLDPRGLRHGRGAFNSSDHIEDSETQGHNTKVAPRQLFAIRYDRLNVIFAPNPTGDRELIVHKIDFVQDPNAELDAFDRDSDSKNT